MEGILSAIFAVDVQPNDSASPGVSIALLLGGNQCML